MTSALSWILAAVLCARAGATESLPEVENEVTLLQKSLHLSSNLRMAGGHNRSKAVPELFVNLDEAPEVRWRNVTRYYTELGIFPHLFQVKREDIKAEDNAFLQHLKIDDEHVRELRGMVADFGNALPDPQATLDALKLAQVGYELSGFQEGPAGLPGMLPGQHDLVELFTNMGKQTGCSGLLATMLNGTVVHVRNMDYVGFEVEVDGRMLHWPDVTTEVTFLRSGKPLYTATQWPGLVGIHTAMRYGGWSFEQNTRFHSKDAAYVGGLRGSRGYMLEARKVMESVPDFETAVSTLRKLDLMGPSYFIVAGAKPFEGAVITMDRGGAHEPKTPLVQRLSSATAEVQATKLQEGQSYTGTWHIIQTNDDQGGLPLDERRPTAEYRLTGSTQDSVSVEWALAQMTKPPLYNSGTVFTTVFVPSRDYHKTYVYPEHVR